MFYLKLKPRQPYLLTHGLSKNLSDCWSMFTDTFECLRYLIILQLRFEELPLLTYTFVVK